MTTVAGPLFARLGWMTFYDSERDSDEEPVGGGSFNDEQVGSEAENFHPLGGHLLGYVRAQKKNGGINASKLGVVTDGKAHGVLVMFVATHPRDGGQRIVGWYGDATCLSDARERAEMTPGAYGLYNIIANPLLGVLLPLDEREKAPLVPGGKGGMGRANVYYGTLDSPWVSEAIAFVTSYRGGNLLSAHNPRTHNSRPKRKPYVRANENTSSAAPLPFSRDPDAMDRALSSHARLQNLVADAAAQAGFKVESPFSGCPDFDVGWRELDGYTVVEIKSLNDGNENHQLRYGLGQVLQYRAALLEHFPSVWPVLAVERAPKDPCWEKLCEELDVYLVWPETLARLFEE